MISNPSAARTGLAVLAVAGLLSACGAGSETAAPAGPPPTGFPAGLEARSVQMHIHGHSHHNGASEPASMQWHSHFAAKTGLDVLWWSPHSEMLDLGTPLEIDYRRREPYPQPSARALRQAGYEETLLRDLSIELVSAPPSDVEWLTAALEATPGRASLRARSVAGMAGLIEVFYELEGPRGELKSFLLPRPVSSGAVLSIDLETGPLAPENLVEFLVYLSFHHRGMPLRHRLRYRLVPESFEPTRQATGPAEVLVHVPVPDGRHRLQLDLEADAALLRDGADNTITSIQMRLGSERGTPAVLDVLGLELSSRAPEPDHQLDQIRRFARGYAAEYRHTQHVGVEFTSRGDDYVHINAFLPGTALTGALASGEESTWNDPAEFVRRVRRLGGVTSFNHLFGTTVGQGPLEVQQRRSRRRALDLLANRAHGVDLLEVGYTRRGGVGLEYHLRTWDILTARGLFLHGNAVSDSHGSAWGPQMMPNHFATWVWSKGPDSAELIEGIRRGRMVFGDPFAYPGKLYFRVGAAEMGDRVETRRAEQPLRVEVDEAFDPARHRLFLVQGRIRPNAPKVRYLTRSEAGAKQPIDPAEPVLVNVRRSTFVRIELWDKDGTPLRFSNPIVFHDADSQTAG